MDRDSPIRVLIVDDHEILRKELALFLQYQDDLLLVGQAENGQQAVELCEQLQPDVVLMDIIMPVMDGIMATQIIVRKHPDIAVLMLTNWFTDGREKESREAGACEYIYKNVTGASIAETIRAAIRDD
jgi:NarL family two-component system response regulator LiaR